MARREHTSESERDAGHEQLSLEPADAPIPYQLTSRARRTIAPERVPQLHVVGDRDVGQAAEADPRPVQARALRRAGLSATSIARRLDADELRVVEWLSAVPALAQPDVPRGDVRPATARAVDDQRPDAAQRAASVGKARDTARRRLRTDARFASGVGLVAGVAEIGTHAVVLRLGEPRVAARVMQWLFEALGVPPTGVSMLLRVGDEVAGDVARHDWARTVGVPLEQIRWTRHGGDVAADGVVALIRVAGASVTATLSGWREALLESYDTPATEPEVDLA